MRTSGEKLKLARDFLGLTQEQVASTLNLTSTILVNIENDKRIIKPGELLKFSKLYGISVEEIISDEKNVDISTPMFARSYEKLSEKDKQEILNLIKFKNSYKE